MQCAGFGRDGIGAEYFQNLLNGYVTNSSYSLHLPIPIGDVETSDGKVFLVIKNSFAGYGDGISVRYRLNDNPTNNDSELDLINGTEIKENGTYYLRAFQANSAAVPSPSSFVDVDCFDTEVIE